MEFIGWDGKTYRGNPPVGWYKATDGRWWPEDHPTVSDPQPVASPPHPPAPPPPVAPPPPGPAPVVSRQRTWLAWAIIATPVLLILFVAAINAADDAPERASRTTQALAGSTAQEQRTEILVEHAAVLRSTCPDVDIVRNSMLVGVRDGDQACSDLVGLQLAILGFTQAEVVSALTGGTEQSNGYRLSGLLTEDGILLGIDA